MCLSQEAEKKAEAEQAATKKAEKEAAAKKKQEEDAKKRTAEAAKRQEQEVQPHKSAWLRSPHNPRWNWAHLCHLNRDGARAPRPSSAPGLGSRTGPVPCHVCSGTELIFSIICTSTGLTFDTICSGTGFRPFRSAPGRRRPHLHRD